MSDYMKKGAAKAGAKFGSAIVKPKKVDTTPGRFKKGRRSGNIGNRQLLDKYVHLDRTFNILKEGNLTQKKHNQLLQVAEMREMYKEYVETAFKRPIEEVLESHIKENITGYGIPEDIEKMQKDANWKLTPPSDTALEHWSYDEHGNKVPISIEDAKKLQTKIDTERKSRENKVSTAPSTNLMDDLSEDFFINTLTGQPINAAVDIFNTLKEHGKLDFLSPSPEGEK